MTIIYDLKQVVKMMPLLRSFAKNTYSLMGEDIIVLDFFNGGKVEGVYVDIGSGHPKWGSNTFLLYRCGWNGLLVDPIRKNIRMSKLLRKRDHSICAGVGSSQNQLAFYELEPYEFSTFDKKIAESRISRKEAKLSGLYQVPIFDFGSLPMIKELDFSKPSFLNIDAEGFDLDILRTIDFEKYSFNLICVEEWKSPLEGYTHIRDFMETNEYRLIARLGTSSFYSKVQRIEKA